MFKKFFLFTILLVGCVAHAQDTSGPVLSSFTHSSTVDITSGAVTVTFTITATDSSTISSVSSAPFLFSNAGSPTITSGYETFSNWSVTSSSTSEWSPSQLSAVKAWVDASDASNYTTSGSTLTGVTDKSGTYTFTVNNTPTVVSNGLNGKTVFDFDDGSNEYIQSTAYRTQTDGSGNHWAIGVFLADVVNNTKNSFWSYETNKANPQKHDYAISSASASNSWPGELDLNGNSSNNISSDLGLTENFSSALAIDNWHIVNAIFNKSGNKIQVRANGDFVINSSDYDNRLRDNQELRLMRNRGCGLRWAFS